MAKRYVVVHAPNLMDFTREVNEKLDTGWELAGGMAVSHRSIKPTQIDQPTFYQSLSKEVAPATPVEMEGVGS